MLHSVFIQNMVSNRCKQIITQLFRDFNLHPKDVFLGEVRLENELTKTQYHSVNMRLEQFGYRLIVDNKAKITTKVKFVLAELFESDIFNLNVNVSQYVAEKLKYEYHYLSNLFSQTENTTIEKYLIQLKIEKAKEYIEKRELCLGEIAFRLGYSSSAHLANQFKQINGITPTQYKNLTQFKFNK